MTVTTKMQLSRGARLRSFEVLGPLGAGGMGAVYRARDERLGREVAIKVLQDRLGESTEHLDRFKREARAASALNHPNIVTIYEIGDAGGVPFIAMELVEGKSLRQRLSRAMSLRAVLEIAVQIADGLAAAHERGIVHRDLKPENLMITPEGRVKILDFGLARFDRPTSAEDSTLALPGQEHGRVVGTASYMSPEQASGASAIDYRSDQFSFGSILYELVSGRRAFQGATTMETLASVMRDPPPPLDTSNPPPEPLRWIIERCLAKERTQRYDSTRDLARDLRTILERLTDSGIVGGTLQHRRASWTVAASLTLVAIATGAALLLRRGPIPAPAEAPARARKHVAVAPFRSEGGTSGLQFLGAGLSEAVRQRLADYDGITVFDHRFTPEASGNEQALRRTAHAVGANLLVTADVRHEQDALLVNYSLLDVPADRTVARRTIRGNDRDLWRLRDQIAAAVVSDIGAGGLQVRGDRAALRSPEEQELYVRALGTMEGASDLTSVDAAIAGFRELLESASDSPLVHASLGRAYYLRFALTTDLQTLEKASRAARRALSLDPDAPETLVTLGMVETSYGNHSQALRAFERALMLQPTSAIAAIGAAQALAAEKRHDEAERMYRRAIGLNPDWWYGHHELANFYWFRRRHDDALREYDEVVRVDPERSTGYTGRGAVLLTRGRLAEAMQAFRKALSFGEDASAYANIGYCQFYSGEYDQAAESMRAALRLQPTRSNYWTNLAEAYAASERFRGEARAAYQTAAEHARAELAVNSGYARAYGTLAVALAHIGDLAGARSAIARARELAPEHPGHMFEAARVANVAGSADEAVSLLEAALARGTPRLQVERHPEFHALRQSGALRGILDRPVQEPATKSRKEPS